MTEKFIQYLLSKGLSTGTIEQYVLYFKKAEEIKKEGLLNQETVNLFINRHPSNTVRSFLKTYFEYYNINDLKVHKRTGRVAKKKHALITLDELGELLYALYQYNEKFGMMAELSYCCALRREEVCAISVADFDWKDWMNKRGNGKLLLKKTKGNKQRYVIVPKYLMIKIAKWINKSILKPNDKIFFKDESHKNISISKQRYWEVYHKFVKELFNKDIGLHTLRRSKATNWFEEGIDIVRIQQRLGHSDISTTRLYINPDETAELKRWSEEI